MKKPLQNDLLRSQSLRHLGENPDLPQGWEAFIEAVSEVYFEADDQRQLLELNQVLASEESHGTNAALRRATQMAEDGARAKSEFLATMSHELRTPINGILGMTELLLQSDLSQDQRGLAASAMRSTEGLLSTVNEILCFTEVQSGDLEYGQVECELREHLAETVDMVARSAEAKGVEFVYLVRKEVPSRVVCDPDRLRQVLLNLLGNAIKFTERGEVALTVELEPRQTAGRDVLRFQISDSGVGIPAHRLDKLFQPFSQVDSSTTRSHGGTGLGLAISKMLVEGMGGSIAVNSSEGAGSTFWFCLPVGASEARSSSAQASELLKGRRVLLIDDHATHRAFLRVSLEGWGAEVLGVSSAEQGLDQLALPGPRWDLVCLDLQMPNLDGEGFLERARQSGASNDIPVILMAPWAERSRARRLVDCGVTEYVIKPIDETSFRKALSSLLGLPQPQPQSKPQELEDALEAPGAALPQEPSTSTERGPDLGSGQVLRLLSGAAEPEAGAGASTAPLVLVVDDHETNRRLMAYHVGRLGYRCVYAVDGVEAVECLKRRKVDLVLLDFHMPRMNGVQVVQWLREQPGALGQVPVIGLTAGACAGDDQRLLDAGGDKVLIKPVRKAEITNAMLEFLPPMEPAGEDQARPLSEADELRRAMLGDT